MVLPLQLTCNGLIDLQVFHVVRRCTLRGAMSEERAAPAIDEFLKLASASGPRAEIELIGS